MSPSPIEGGHVISGKYQLVRLLGRGSMGEVWIAHHKTLGEDVAIKLLASAHAASEIESYPTAAARFRFEAQVAARLSRKTRHIVRVTDHGEEEGDAPAYLVMELLVGQTLERRLAMYGAMTPDEAFRLVAQIARALECAHAESVVHRDLKPANTFLARDEDGEVLVKLLDFGIARATRTQRMASFSTGQGIVFGTPGYMSPEQASGAKLDGRVDLWALATVAYEALTGELPLRGTYTHELLRSLHLGEIVPIHDRNPDLPVALDAFFRRAFDPRIEHRFASASEFVSSFAQAIATPASLTGRTAPMPATRGLRSDTLPMAVESAPAPKPLPPRRRAWQRLAGACGLALIAVLATLVFRTPSIGGIEPASSSAVASTPGPPSAFALAPEARAPTEPTPSATEIVPPLPQSPSNPPASRPTRAVVGPASPKGTAAPASPQASGPPVPSSVPAAPPSVAPASRAPIDRSATL